MFRLLRKPKTIVASLLLMLAYFFGNIYAGPSERQVRLLDESELRSIKSIQALNQGILERSLYLATSGTSRSDEASPPLNGNEKEWLRTPRVKTAEDFLKILKNIAATAVERNIALPSGYLGLLEQNWEQSEAQLTMRNAYLKIIEAASRELSVEEALTATFQYSGTENSQFVQKFVSYSLEPVLRHIFTTELNSYWTVRTDTKGYSLPANRGFEVSNQLRAFVAGYPMIASKGRHFLPAPGTNATDIYSSLFTGANKAAFLFYQNIGGNLTQLGKDTWDLAAQSEDFYPITADLIALRDPFTNIDDSISIESVQYTLVVKAIEACANAAGQVSWSPAKRVVKVSEIFSSLYSSIIDNPVNSEETVTYFPANSGLLEWGSWNALFVASDDMLNAPLIKAWIQLVEANLLHSTSADGRRLSLVNGLRAIASQLGRNSLNLTPAANYTLLKEIIKTAHRVAVYDKMWELKNARRSELTTDELTEVAIFEFMLQNYSKGIPAHIFAEYTMAVSENAHPYLELQGSRTVVERLNLQSFVIGESTTPGDSPEPRCPRIF